MTMWYLFLKTIFREVGNLFGYNRGTIHKVFYKVLDTINRTEELRITWPNDRVPIGSGFNKLSKFPGAVGAVDGTHIKVRPPAKVQPEYHSRKHEDTMILMAICDATLKFTMVATGFPGSIHDQRALDLTTFEEEMKPYPIKYFSNKEQHVLGDSAFTLQMNVMTPYRYSGHLTQSQMRFNKTLSQ